MIESGASTFFLSTGASWCLEKQKLWFLHSAVHQFGIKLGYVGTRGQAQYYDSMTGETSTMSYMGGNIGWGTYYRLRGNLFRGHLSVGAEVGYEGLKISDLRQRIQAVYMRERPGG